MLRSKRGRVHRKIIGILICIGLSFIPPFSFGGEQMAKPEVYTGVAVGTGGPMAAKSLPFDLRINQYTSDEEVTKYVTILRESGEDALRRALEKEDRGQISPVGRVGNAVAVARKRQEGANTVITVVTARTLPFIELYAGGRSTDYQFGILQITLNAKGEGTGNIMAAARISFNKKKDVYEVESFGNQYIKATNIRVQK